MSETKLVTILTPTYNRRCELERLYNSLCIQSKKDFVWFVVDDGSTDETCTFVNNLSSSDFEIKYKYKENGGKHTALNRGIEQINTELTFIVDSDDYLMENAIENILNIHSKYKGNEEICGYSFLRCFPNGEINGKKFLKEEWVTTYLVSRINSKDTNSDKAEVYFTKCLKEFPFPEYPCEKFLGEDIVWCRMARKYKMVHINRAIYIGNYLKDGLTQNRREHNLDSPLGCMNRSAEFLEDDITLVYRIKNGVQYVIYGRFAGFSMKDLMKNSGHPLLIIICSLPGLILYYLWCHKYKRD